MSVLKRNVVWLALPLVLLSACSPSPDQIKKVLAAHPEIVFEAIEKNPQKFAETAQKAIMDSRRAMADRQQQDAAKEMENQVKNPKKVALPKDRAVRGSRTAPIVLVEYSDFQCPYCKRGYETVNELRKKYGDKLMVMYKHLPLDFHPMAMPAAKRFEAIALQSPDKAYKFHDAVFADQGQLAKDGEKFLDEMAKKAGANVAQMKKDMDSDKVRSHIAADTKEAQELGIRGTPGFLFNGVVVHGALPISQFEQIFQKRPTYN